MTMAESDKHENYLRSLTKKTTLYTHFVLNPPPANLQSELLANGYQDYHVTRSANRLANNACFTVSMGVNPGTKTPASYFKV